MFRCLLLLITLVVLACSTPTSTPSPSTGSPVADPLSEGGSQEAVDDWVKCVYTYDLWAFGSTETITELFQYSGHEDAFAAMSEHCKMALEAELLRRRPSDG